MWCTAATAKASLAAVQSFSFLSFGAADQGAPVRCVTEPATTVNSWRESTLLCEIFGSSLGSNPCRQPTTSSKAGQRASACREKISACRCGDLKLKRTVLVSNFEVALSSVNAEKQTVRFDHGSRPENSGSNVRETNQEYLFFE